MLALRLPSQRELVVEKPQLFGELPIAHKEATDRRSEADPPSGVLQHDHTLHSEDPRLFDGLNRGPGDIATAEVVQTERSTSQSHAGQPGSDGSAKREETSREKGFADGVTKEHQMGKQRAHGRRGGSSGQLPLGEPESEPCVCSQQVLSTSLCHAVQNAGSTAQKASDSGT